VPASPKEFDSILHGAAFARVSDRAFLRITGSDATRWLNGMVTNSIQALAPGEGCYNFLLNAQGRIQGDCTIYRDPSEEAERRFLLATGTAQIETIQTLLEKFIIMDDVELERTDHTEDTVVVLAGPNAPSKLREIEHPWFDDTVSFSDLKPLSLRYYPLTTCQISTPRPSAVTVFELDPGFDETSVADALISAGVTEVSAKALEHLRIYEGRPKFGVDIRERDLPQETNQAHALHFSKGCYLGQEIVERIRSRGQVHRLFTRFTLIGELPHDFPAPLESNGKPAGELTSAAQIGDTIYALGYARREFLESRAPFIYPGGTATPRAASN
jgi:folate-binding protein YgfZ